MAAKPKTPRTKLGRFKKGVSGNLNGRPRKSASGMTKAIEKVLNQPVTIIEKGKRRRVTKKEVIAMQLVNQATQGELRAAQLAMNASRHNDEAAPTPASAESWAFTDDDQKVIAQVVERILLSAPEKSS